MKVKVKIGIVQDKETGKTYKHGETLELPEDRALFAIAHGYVEEVKNDDAKKSRKVSTPDHD